MIKQRIYTDGRLMYYVIYRMRLKRFAIMTYTLKGDFVESNLYSKEELDKRLEGLTCTK